MATPSRKIVQMAAVFSAMRSIMGSAQAAAPQHVELPTLIKLIGQLRQDAALRARFSRDPGSVFEETGIDPTPYDLPARLDEDDVHRFLSDWTGAKGPAAGSRPAAAVPPLSEDRSGRLPTLANRHSEKPASASPAATPGDPQASGDETTIPPSPAPPAPVAPVYGPPPGLRNKPPEPVVPSSPSPNAPVHGPPPGRRTKP